MAPNRFTKDGLLRDHIKYALKPYFKFNKNSNIEPLESWVLIAHYKFTVGILICLFISIVGCWFATSPMECILKYDRSELKDYEEELCLSYPYTYNDKHERVYALHYKWVHWSLLGLIPLYSIPLYLKKYFEIDILNMYLHYVDTADKRDPKRMACISNLIDGFIGYSTGDFFFEKLQILFITCIVDMAAFIFIDVSLQNRFARLLPLDYPFTRWPQFFNDTLSQAFPPFAECKIGKEMLIVNEMEETIGCKLNLMKIYDKLFVIMWVWMAALTMWTLLVIFYYIILGLSRSHQRSLIKIKDCDTEVEICVRSLSLGDLMLINSLDGLLNTEEKEEALRKIVEKIRLCKKNGWVLD